MMLKSVRPSVCPILIYAKTVHFRPIVTLEHYKDSYAMLAVELTDELGPTTTVSGRDSVDLDKFTW